MAKIILSGKPEYVSGCPIRNLHLCKDEECSVAGLVLFFNKCPYCTTNPE